VPPFRPFLPNLSPSCECPTPFFCSCPNSGGGPFGFLISPFPYWASPPLFLSANFSSRKCFFFSFFWSASRLRQSGRLRMGCSGILVPSRDRAVSLLFSSGLDSSLMFVCSVPNSIQRTNPSVGEHTSASIFPLLRLHLPQFSFPISIPFVLSLSLNSFSCPSGIAPSAPPLPN